MAVASRRRAWGSGVGRRRRDLRHDGVAVSAGSPGRLALRLATMFDMKRYRTDFAFEKKRAVTLTATYQPFKHTTVRAFSEFGHTDSHRLALPDPRSVCLPPTTR